MDLCSYNSALLTNLTNMKILLETGDSKEQIMVADALLANHIVRVIERDVVNCNDIHKSGEEEEPLHNYIFDSSVFDSDNRLRRLRNCIAASIDMGNGSSKFGEPQTTRINPETKCDWYYIIKPIKEARAARSFTIPVFFDQMREWFPELFQFENDEAYKDYKRSISRGISDEKGRWTYGVKKEEISLQDMWAKKDIIRLSKTKLKRVDSIARMGLKKNLMALMQEYETEKMMD